MLKMVHDKHVMRLYSCLQAISQFGVEEEAELQLLARWTVTLPYLLKAELSGSPPEEHLQVCADVSWPDTFCQSRWPWAGCLEVHM